MISDIMNCSRNAILDLKLLRDRDAEFDALHDAQLEDVPPIDTPPSVESLSFRR